MSYYLDIGFDRLAFGIDLIIQLLLFTVIILTYLKFRKDKKLIYILCAAVLVFGFIRMQAEYDVYSEKSVFYRSYRLQNEKNVVLYGKLIEQPDIRENNIKLIISADSLSYNSTSEMIEGNIIVNIFRDKNYEIINDKLDYGTYIRIKGTLKPLPVPKIPGEFDYGEYLRLHGIHGSFSIYGYSNLSVLGQSYSSPVNYYLIYPLKKYIISTVDNYIGGYEGEFLKGLLIGERSGFAKQMKADFINAGIAHIIAVSGLNVVYIIIMLSVILSFLPIKYEIKSGILILFLLFYMVLTGSVPSIVRATIMAVTFLIADIIQRKAEPFNVISFSALVILVFDPLQLFDSGFILSYTAVLSLIILNKLFINAFSKTKFNLWLEENNPVNRSIKYIIYLFIATTAAQIGILPITMLLFKKISIVSLFVNIFAIPVSNIILALGFMIVLFSAVIPFFAVITAALTKFMLYYFLVLVNYFANFDISFIETYNYGIIFLIIYYAVLVILFYYKAINLYVKLASVILIIFIYGLFSDIFKSSEMQINYLDAGRSNSSLIITPNKHSILINTGSAKDNYSFSDYSLYQFLKSYDLSEIDLLILTSVNEGELRSLYDLKKKIQINKIMFPEIYKPLFNGNEIKSLLNNFDYLESSETISSFELDNVLIDIQSINESTFLYVIYGSNKFSFLELNNKNDLLQFTFNSIEKCDVLYLVDSKRSFDQFYSLIEFSRPQTILFNSSDYKAGEIFRKTNKLIGNNCIDIYQNGSVIFKTDGSALRLVDWR